MQLVGQPVEREALRGPNAEIAARENRQVHRRQKQRRGRAANARHSKQEDRHHQKRRGQREFEAVAVEQLAGDGREHHARHARHQKRKRGIERGKSQIVLHEKRQQDVHREHGHERDEDHKHAAHEALIAKRPHVEQGVVNRALANHERGQARRAHHE